MTPSKTIIHVPAAIVSNGFRTKGRAAKAKPPKDDTYRYRAKTSDCSVCALKPICCPKETLRKVPRSIYEAARDRARAIALTDEYQVSRDERKKVEMLFAHLKSILKTRPIATARSNRSQ